MVPAPPPPPPGAAIASARRGGGGSGAGARGWQAWLLLGICTGLGYGLTQRLLDLQPGEPGLGGHQSFAVKAFPGTSLDGLRRGQRAGASRSLRADLDAVAAERRRKQEAKELEQRQVEIEQRQREEQSRLDAEQDRLRLEELNDTPEPPADPSLDLPPADPAPASPSVPAPGEDSIYRP